MRTPRPSAPRRGIGTLIGNGWLHESPKNIWPGAFDVRGRSALRKCMFLPVPPGVREQLGAPSVSPAAMAPPPRPPEPAFVPHRRNPEKDVRCFPAVPPHEVHSAQKHFDQRALYLREREKLLANAPARSWYEDPVALGTLLIMCPPIGLAALWSSKRYSSDARWALTVMTALMMCLGAAIAVALIVRA